MERPKTNKTTKIKNTNPKSSNIGFLNLRETFHVVETAYNVHNEMNIDVDIHPMASDLILGNVAMSWSAKNPVEMAADAIELASHVP